MISVSMMDAIFVVSEERGISINEIIAACENVMDAEVIAKADNSNIEIDRGDRQLYEEVLKVWAVAPSE